MALTLSLTVTTTELLELGMRNLEWISVHTHWKKSTIVQGDCAILCHYI